MRWPQQIALADQRVDRLRPADMDHFYASLRGSLIPSGIRKVNTPAHPVDIGPSHRTQLSTAATGDRGEPQERRQLGILELRGGQQPTPPESVG